jgi:hypothetical protein
MEHRFPRDGGRFDGLTCLVGHFFMYCNALEILVLNFDHEIQLENALILKMVS